MRTQTQPRHAIESCLPVEGARGGNGRSEGAGEGQSRATLLMKHVEGRELFKNALSACTRAALASLWPSATVARVGHSQCPVQRGCRLQGLPYLSSFSPDPALLDRPGICLTCSGIPAQTSASAHMLPPAAA